MQEKFELLPMVQSYICFNIPQGGYKIVSKRLSNQGIKISNTALASEVRTIKRNPGIAILIECCKFMKESAVPLDPYCEDFLRSQT